MKMLMGMLLATSIPMGLSPHFHEDRDALLTPACSSVGMWCQSWAGRLQHCLHSSKKGDQSQYFKKKKNKLNQNNSQAGQVQGLATSQ